jgi:hypothetical protein
VGEGVARKPRRSGELARNRVNWLASVRTIFRLPPVIADLPMSLRPGRRFLGILNPMDQRGPIAPFQEPPANQVADAVESDTIRPSAAGFAAETVSAAWLLSWCSLPYLAGSIPGPASFWGAQLPSRSTAFLCPAQAARSSHGRRPGTAPTSHVTRSCDLSSLNNSAAHSGAFDIFPASLNARAFAKAWLSDDRSAAG